MHIVTSKFEKKVLTLVNKIIVKIIENLKKGFQF